MTSRNKIQISSKVTNMSEGLQSLVGKKSTKDHTIMGQKIEISKLTVAEVLEIQDMAKEAGEDEKANFELLRTVIRKSAKGAENMSDDDFDGFPIDELSKLSAAIMEFSGMGKQKGKSS